MNKKLQKQIKAYAGLAGALLVADKANGQVVYVDVNPDTLLYTNLNYVVSTIIFDLNQDGQHDFQFNAYNWNSPTSNMGHWINGAIWVNGYNNNKVLNDNISGCFITPIAFPLNQGDSIPSVNQLNNFANAASIIDWQNIFISPGLPTYQVCFNAMTSSGQDVYIGVKFDISGQFHYGWFKVELVGGVLIKEYAYELQPNVPILISDTTNLPLASITPQGPLSFCIGDSVLLSANPGAGLSYQWKRFGIPIPGATAQNYLATAPGKYRVVVTNAAGSSTSAPVKITPPCNPIDASEKTGMEISTDISEYNQTQFIFSRQNNTIHISSFEKLNHSDISVYDLLGKEILQQPFEGNETTITIDKKGIYFVEVKNVPNSSGGIFRKKIFIY